MAITKVTGALLGNYTGGSADDTVVIGDGAGDAITTGTDNTFIGDNAGSATTTASNNVAVGSSALLVNTTGASNVAVGYLALTANTTAGANVAISQNALLANTTGAQNVSIGYNSMYTNTTGANNVALGTSALYTNNADNNTYISFHSQKSQSSMPNLIRWNGLKSQPCFDYINGMLKISDGNFNNDNNNKLLYYAGKENTNGSSELGWVVRDEALQNPPTCSVSSINDSEILTSYVNGVNELNERYIQTTTIPGAAGAPDLTITTKQLGNYDGTSGVRKNANSVASAFGQNDPQGFVLRYWFDKRYSPTVGVDPIRHGSDGTGQIMIPRYNITPGGSQASAWYANNIESNNYTGGGGYNNNIAGTLPTGEGNLETGDTGDSR